MNICITLLYILFTGGKAQEGAVVPLPRPKNDEEHEDESVTDKWSTQSVLSNDSSWQGSGSADFSRNFSDS